MAPPPANSGIAPSGGGATSEGSVTAMLVTYALEQRSRWFILAFAASRVLGSVYGFMQGAWPFGLVEGVWFLVALRRWMRAGNRT